MPIATNTLMTDSGGYNNNYEELNKLNIIDENYLYISHLDEGLRY
jgi:hypothetical protein